LTKRLPNVCDVCVFPVRKLAYDLDCFFRRFDLLPVLFSLTYKLALALWKIRFRQHLGYCCSRRCHSCCRLAPTLPPRPEASSLDSRLTSCDIIAVRSCLETLLSIVVSEALVLLLILNSLNSSAVFSVSFSSFRSISSSS
jgi:hypothetical protein